MIRSLLRALALCCRGDSRIVLDGRDAALGYRHGRRREIAFRRSLPHGRKLALGRRRSVVQHILVKRIHVADVLLMHIFCHGLPPSTCGGLPISSMIYPQPDTSLRIFGQLSMSVRQRRSAAGARYARRARVTRATRYSMNIASPKLKKR